MAGDTTIPMEAQTQLKRSGADHNDVSDASDAAPVPFLRVSVALKPPI